MDLEDNLPSTLTFTASKIPKYKDITNEDENVEHFYWVLESQKHIEGKDLKRSLEKDLRAIFGDDVDLTLFHKNSISNTRYDTGTHESLRTSSRRSAYRRTGNDDCYVYPTKESNIKSPVSPRHAYGSDISPVLGSVSRPKAKASPAGPFDDLPWEPLNPVLAPLSPEKKLEIKKELTKSIYMLVDFAADIDTQGEANASLVTAPNFPSCPLRRKLDSLKYQMISALEQLPPYAFIHKVRPMGGLCYPEVIEAQKSLAKERPSDSGIPYDKSGLTSPTTNAPSPAKASSSRASTAKAYRVGRPLGSGPLHRTNTSIHNHKNSHNKKPSFMSSKHTDLLLPSTIMKRRPGRPPKIPR